ncbi:uncharacterized protein L969DRAFT_457829 [Mixia osmundae IAM 14324]|uniref:uncharacterized protein n=1 Tax=Mixia osmundae (strain CBS 9802 / IAM 14324 / JCM 22182 / KY 12970) TaxID=764103 RepID=UPI0004A55162|nr:uncharacterized protein L969DRAFT_457829 [Mixia osmundae IAM 14324]KEI39600.1 hypothetical protein L969DRAFT_457829 [Mixia osmundae IAM 14324]
MSTPMRISPPLDIKSSGALEDQQAKSETASGTASSAATPKHSESTSDGESDATSGSLRQLKVRDLELDDDGATQTSGSKKTKLSSGDESISPQSSAPDELHKQSTLAERANEERLMTPPRTPELGRGFPVEIFRHIASHIAVRSTADLLNATLVCKAWRQILLDDPELWRHNYVLDLTSRSAQAALQCFLPRARQGLRSLTILLSDAYSNADFQLLHDHWRMLIRTFLTIEPGDALERIKVNCLADDRDTILALFVVLTKLSCQLPSLLTFLCNTRMSDRFGIMKRFFTSLPVAVSVEITCLVQQVEEQTHAPPFQWLGMPEMPMPLALPLTRLSLVCVDLTLLDLPMLPNLRFLSLEWCLADISLWQILANAPNLEILDLSQTDSTEEEEEAVSIPLDGQRRHLLLPRLRQLTVYGPSSVLFWVPETDEPLTPEVHMPALLECKLIKTRNLNEAPSLSASIFDIEEEADCLRALASLAPQITRLSLDYSTVEDMPLWQSLGCFANITYLSLKGTEVTDLLIMQLPDLTPGLREIDVRNCPGVNAGALASVVERIRENSDGARRLQKAWCDEPVSFGGTEIEVAERLAYQWLEFQGVVPDMVRMRWHEKPRRYWKSPVGGRPWLGPPAVKARASASRMDERYYTGSSRRHSTETEEPELYDDTEDEDDLSEAATE